MKQDKFIWSTSTNAYQIEGGRSLGGRSESIWDDFTKKNYYIPPAGSTEREINSIEIAADFYHHYSQDAKIMRHANINGFVYNLDWTRIYPKNAIEVNKQGLKWTKNFFKSMTKNRVEVIPILFHWDTPMWAQVLGGWENREIVDWFRNYVATMFKNLGKYSNHWFVTDENSSFTLFGYLNTVFPPAKVDPTAFVKAVHHLNLAAAVTKEEFDNAKTAGYLNKEAILGIDHDWSPAIAYDHKDPDDIAAAKEYNEWFLNFWLDPNFKGTYPKPFYDFIKDQNIDFSISKDDLKFLKEHKLDFIGWNYYRPCYVASRTKKINPKLLQRSSDTFLTTNFQMVYPKKNVRYTSWNWIIDSSQLIPGAKTITKRYGKEIPIMIVENGLGAFDDKTQVLIKDYERIEYLKEHIEAVLEAKKEGINFIGYSLWTYCDIFSPSAGYRKDYGLVSVDFNDPNRTRKPKLSYVWYEQVIASNGSDTSTDWAKLELDLEKVSANKKLFSH